MRNENMAIEISDLHHTYPGGVEALRGIDLEVADNTSVAIIGQNGAGKTTLVKHLNGLLHPTSGTVLIDGSDTRTRTTASWSRTVGYVFQNPDDQLFREEVQSELEFGPKRLGMKNPEMQQHIEYSLDITGLESEARTHPYDLPRPQRKFVAIASVLAMNPEIIILDEPTTGQDLRGTRTLTHIVDSLLERGKTVITISHDMKFVAEHFDRVVALCRGEVIADGPTREVFGRPKELARTFVSPPPITQLVQTLGFDRTLLSVPEFLDFAISIRNVQSSS
jgi:energy-coupling factor transport system ATP-binding protein